MSRAYLLDTGPLGRLAHPKMNPDTAAWLRGLLEADIELYIPEIADYELRRELIRAGLTESIERLDGLKAQFLYLPLDTPTMLKAAEFWALARNRGQPAADPKELDGDVILAAQAHQIGAGVLTENVGHLAPFVEARYWRDIVKS